MRGRRERGPWYLLTGLIIGVVFGVLYAWLVSPVEYVDTPPASLRADFKDQYRQMIALAHQANGDLNRASVRLSLLQDADPAAALAAQAQRARAQGASAQEAEALAGLASALGQPVATLPASLPPLVLTDVGATLAPESAASTASASPTAASPTAGSATRTPSPTVTRTPTRTPTPLATFTPLPTRTPTPTQGAPFALTGQEQVCDPALGEPLIQVYVFDAAENPVPSVEILVTWGLNGQDRFFTGLKPELGLGYADFTMTPGEVYTLRLASGGLPVENLSAEECARPSGERYWGSWKLTFTQP